MKQVILDALEKRYQAQISEADATIKIVPLPAAGAASEVAKDYTISAGAEGWRTITLDLTQDYIDLDAVNGVKIEPNPHGSIPIFYWDNLFAWSAPSNNTVASFSVDANNAGAIFDATGGEVLAISYSTDGGSIDVEQNASMITPAQGWCS